MSIPTLFIDRDGTLIEEPPDQQVDRLEKIRFMPGVFAALQALDRAGFRLIMITNQDGLGSPHYPEQAYRVCQHFLLDTFASQGIRFQAIFFCPHRASDGCACRKPKPGLLTDFLAREAIDLTRSAVIGDRATDLELAQNLGVRGLRIRREGLPEETWPEIVRTLTQRRARVQRRTRETEITAEVNLDGTDESRIATGIGFFDHMLEQVARHGGFSLQLTARGDLEVDEHHTVEDCGLTLGAALKEALGPKLGVARYGFALPMDEAEAAVLLDLSGRPFAKFSGRFAREQVGAFPTELVPHFFRSLSEGLGAAIHISVLGENTHHMVEACFKGVGRTLRQAMRREGDAVPSTKGVL
jgi:imidazoleglycerol-phosphate dehydratase / histidinol-phosphatase